MEWKNLTHIYTKIRSCMGWLMAAILFLALMGMSVYAQGVSAETNDDSTPIDGVSDGEEYKSERTISFDPDKTKVSLNQDPNDTESDITFMEDGDSVQQLGNHTLWYCDLETSSCEGDGDWKSISFTMKPSFEGFAYAEEDTPKLRPEDSITVSAVSPTAFTLDGATYEYLNENVAYEKFYEYEIEPGLIEFSFEGINGYEDTFEFRLKGSVEGIGDGEIYDSAPSFKSNFKNVELNDIDLGDYDDIGVFGGNTLTFYDRDNTTQKAINFDINPTYAESLDDPSEGSEGSLALNVSYGDVYINDDASSVANDYTLDTVGIHDIRIDDPNSDQSIHFDDFHLHPNIEGVENGASYNGSIAPEVDGELELNGQIYTSGDAIREFGNHILMIYGENEYEKTVEFELYPEFDGISDGEAYYTLVELSVNTERPFGGTFTLNGTAFSEFNEPTVIDTVGSNVFEYETNDGFSGELRFEIEEFEGSYSGIENDQTYHTSKDFNTNYPDVYVNGELVESNSNNDTLYESIGEVGENIVELYDYSQSEGPAETLTFHIEPTYNDALDEGEIKGPLSLDISVGEATLDGAPIDNNETIDALGHYEIVIKSNQDDYVFNVTVHPDFEGVSDSGIYTEPITIDANTEGDYEINGDAYELGTSIAAIGGYELLALGENDYETTLTFDIDPIINNVSDGETYQEALDIEIEGKLSETTAITLNGESVTTVSPITLSLDQMGTYNLKITSFNDYEKTLDFAIEASFDSLNDGDEFYGSMRANVFGGSVTINGSTPQDCDDESTCNVSIDQVGHYKLKIEGHDEQSTEKTFTVHPKITLDDNEHTPLDDTYYENINFTIEGNIDALYLNGETLNIDNQKNLAYETFGVYEMKVIGVGDYEETHVTTIDVPDIPSDYAQPNQSYYDETPVYFASDEYGGAAIYEYDFTWSSLQNNANHNRTLSLDKDQTLYAIGEYELKLYGPGGFERDFSFFVEPFDSRGNHDDEFEENAGFTFLEVHPDTKLLKNEEIDYYQEAFEVGNYSLIGIGKDSDELSDSQHVYSAFGNYQLKLVNTSDRSYAKNINFTLDSDLKILDNQHDKPLKLTYLPNIKEWSLNGEDYGTSDILIDAHGENTVTVYGLDGYEKEYEFIIANPYRSMFFDTYPLMLIVVAAGGFVLLVRRGIQHD